MKRKLVSVLVVLTLGMGYCAPPREDCTGIKQNPAVCRGFIKPNVPVIVRPK
jgi:hypothetical protein